VWRQDFCRSAITIVADHPGKWRRKTTRICAASFVQTPRLSFFRH
jgi:hypothetical protein